MQKPNGPSRGQFFFILILLLAFGLRFVNLGQLPLSEFEARAALAADALAHGQPGDLGAQPGYALLTSLLFRLLPSSNFLARLWPALAGLALVALPYFWRDKLGHKTALVFTLLLALDPGQAALARLAGGYSLALSAGLWAASLLARGRALTAGVLAAAALLAGPSLYFGLVAAGLAWLVARPQLPALPWRKALPPLLITLALGGTLLLSAPQGIAGAGLTLAGFLFGQAQLAPASIGRVLFALLGYGLPALGFGLLHLLRRRDSVTLPAAAFAAAALLLVLLHPQRQVADLAWVLLPLWGLAAAEISLHLRAPVEEPWATYGQFGLISLFSIFLAILLAQTSSGTYLLFFEPGRLLPVVNTQLGLALMVLLVAAAASLLIGLGWSGRAAIQGLAWSLSLTACLCLLAAGSRYGR
ncbi:MAG: hypothetical protein KIS85_07030, partial [Anaerolineales bacterium]|nr:hypothetical protein [Anaerolineales bacterium]